MTQEKISFDLGQALADLKAGKPLSGKDGLLMPLKQLTEAALTPCKLGDALSFPYLKGLDALPSYPSFYK